MDQFSEDEPDELMLPHPLPGKLTMREMIDILREVAALTNRD